VDRGSLGWQLQLTAAADPAKAPEEKTLAQTLPRQLKDCIRAESFRSTVRSVQRLHDSWEKTRRDCRGYMLERAFVVIFGQLVIGLAQLLVSWREGSPGYAAALCLLVWVLPPALGLWIAYASGDAEGAEECVEIAKRDFNLAWSTRGIEFRLVAGGPYAYWTFPSARLGLRLAKRLELVVDGSATVAEKVVGGTRVCGQGERFIELPMHRGLSLFGYNEDVLQSDTPMGLTHLVTDVEYDDETTLLNEALAKESMMGGLREWGKTMAGRGMLVVSGAAACEVLVGLFKRDYAEFFNGMACMHTAVLACYAVGGLAKLYLSCRSARRRGVLDKTLAEINCRWADRGLRWECQREEYFTGPDSNPVRAQRKSLRVVLVHCKNE